MRVLLALGWAGEALAEQELFVGGRGGGDVRQAERHVLGRRLHLSVRPGVKRVRREGRDFTNGVAERGEVSRWGSRWGGELREMRQQEP